MLKVILALGSKSSGLLGLRSEAVALDEDPFKVKDKVVPFPVEGLGNTIALETESAAAAAALGSWPQTKPPERYPVTWASSKKLVLAAKLQSLLWVMLLQSLLLNRPCTWIDCPGCSTIFPVKL